MLKMVVMKLAAPMMDEAPAKCSENSARSIAGLEWKVLSESGG